MFQKKRLLCDDEGNKLEGPPCEKKSKSADDSDAAVKRRVEKWCEAAEEMVNKCVQFFKKLNSIGRRALEEEVICMLKQLNQTLEFPFPWERSGNAGSRISLAAFIKCAVELGRNLRDYSSCLHSYYICNCIIKRAMARDREVSTLSNAPGNFSTTYSNLSKEMREVQVSFVATRYDKSNKASDVARVTKKASATSTSYDFISTIEMKDGCELSIATFMAQPLPAEAGNHS
jgi:hypothetical protein